MFNMFENICHYTYTDSHISSQLARPFTDFCLDVFSSSDKKQKDPGSAWYEEHSSGGRSPNPFPDVWNHVRLCSFLMA